MRLPLALLRRGLAVASLALALPLAACGDSTGPSSTATITFWTSDPAPSPIAVVLDGSNIGTLTAYRTTAPACGSSSGSTISMTVASGSHTWSAYETQASGTWGPGSVSLSGGDCRLIELGP